MTRRARKELPDGIFHVTSRGTNHCAIYLDDLDREAFLTILGSVVDCHDWLCRAFCLMSNHYHLIVEAEQPHLSRGMQRLNGRYAQLFNQRHDRDGHLFRGRYSVFVIDSESQFEASCRYVLDNPVRAGLCKTASDWPWSGCPSLEAVSGTGT
jgi:putative transposase